MIQFNSDTSSVVTFASTSTSASASACASETPAQPTAKLPLFQAPARAPMASFLRSRRPTPGSGVDKPGAISALSTIEEEPSRLTFMSLPTEIHLAISKMLIYPDALSLKHTNAHLYSLVDTGVNLKVEWLVERRSLHLECPNDRRCDLRSDLRFCRGSVPLLMQRRREHFECESRPGLGCLVYGTRLCSHRSAISRRLPRWLQVKLTVELWWILLALVPVFCGWLWLTELFR